MKDIFALKVKQGRILNGMSLQNLADFIGVSKQMISKYENALAFPSSHILIELSKALKVKVDYFFTPASIELGEINFRKKSQFSQKQENALKENIKNKVANYLEIENILKIDNTFSNPLKKKTVASIDKSTIQSIVNDLRKEWEIGIDPIHNIIQLLEDKEIKVIEISEIESTKFDGLATIIDNKYPVIVINKNFNIERKRFTLLHELGHLLLDLPDCDNKTEEKICNIFAAEFLLPESILIKEFGAKRTEISTQELITIQRKYGISIQAIIYKLSEASIITQHSLESFFKKLNYDSHFKAQINLERFQTPEVSERFQQLVYRALSQELISSSKAATLLNIDINKVLEQSII